MQQFVNQQINQTFFQSVGRNKTLINKNINMDNKEKSSQKKFEEVRGTSTQAIEVEYCQNCELHAHIVRHLPNKYQYFYDQIKRKFKSYKIAVRKRTKQPQQTYITPSFQQTDQPPEDQVESAVTSFFPRVGAFEVYFRDQIIFSKLETGTWPVLETLLKQVIFTIDYENQKNKPKNKPIFKRSIHLGETLNVQSKKQYYQNYYLSKNKTLSNQKEIPRRYIHSVQRQVKNYSLSDKPDKGLQSLNLNSLGETIPRAVKSENTKRWGRYNKQQFSQRQKQIINDEQKETRVQGGEAGDALREFQEDNRIHYHDYKKRLAEKLKKLRQLTKAEKQFGIQVFDTPLQIINQSPKQIKVVQRRLGKHKKQINAKINSMGAGLDQYPNT